MAFTGLTNPTVVSLAFQGALAAMPSNNRQQAVNSEVDTDEEAAALVRPATAYQLAALAFAVAVDQAFDEIGGYDPDSGETDNLLISICKGVWVNRWAALPISDIPDEPEDLEPYIENVSAAYGPATDPATYLPVARSIVIPTLLGEDVLSAGTSGEATMDSGSTTPWSHWKTLSLPYAIAQGASGNILTTAFNAPRDIEFVEAILTVNLLANGGAFEATLDSPDVTGYSQREHIASGERAILTFHGMFTGLTAGDHTWAFTLACSAGAGVGLDGAGNGLLVLRETQRHDVEA